MKKENGQKNIKGVTLLEIVIVLAVVSVMSVMVVTFSLMCSGWMSRGIAQNDVFSNINVIENIVKDLFNDCDNEQYSFGVNAEGKLEIVEKTNGGEHSYFTEFKKTLDYKGQLDVNSPKLNDGENKGITIPTENIESITFSVVRNDETDKALIICDISYNLPAKGDYIAAEKGSYRIMYATRAAKYYTGSEVVAP